MRGVLLDPVTGRPTPDLEERVPDHIAYNLRMGRLLGQMGPMGMADSKISALTDGSPLAATDALVIARAGASLKVLGSGLPGAEIKYAQITTGVNVTSTTESSGTTIISPGAVTFDGQPVICQFGAGRIITPSAAGNDFMAVSLFEGATQITRLLLALSSGAAYHFPVFASYRFTPTAGSHTYTITAFVSSTTGTPNIQAGSGGTGGEPPAFVRFTKV